MVGTSVVFPKHDQMTLHGLDIGFRKSVGSHVDAILGTYGRGGALAVEQGVGPQGPLIVGPHLFDVETERVFRSGRHPLQLGQLPFDDSAEHCLDLGPSEVQVGLLGKHRGVFQNGIESGCQPTRHHRARRLQAHKKMRAAQANGKRAGRSTPPIIGRLAAKDVDSHRSATSCAAGVCRRAVHQLPSQADFLVFSMVVGALAGDAVLIAPVSWQIPC